MSTKISRRSYLKYAGAVGLAAAGAVTGAYYFSRPEVPPTQTGRVTSTSPTFTGQTSTATLAQTTATLTQTTSTLYSRQQMPDFWRGFWSGVPGGGPDDSKPYLARIGFDRMRERLNSPDVAIYNQFWTSNSESADVFEVEGQQPAGARDHYPRPILKQVIDIAHSTGLRVAYWPYLGPLTFEPCPGNEQGLTPTPKVFEAYRRLKAEEARLAEKLQCEMFWVGGEWNEGYKHGREFSQLLEAVRSNFSGRILVECLFYDQGAVNEVLREIDPESFELMDYLGLSMLIFPMSKDYTGEHDTVPTDCTPSVPTMMEKLKRRADLARKASERFHKPIIFPELHAYAYDGAAYRNPWSHEDVWIRDVDLQEQADIIEAAMRVLTGLECCHGVSWNCYYGAPDPGLDYSPSERELRDILYNGRPAEKVLRFWYSKKNIRDGVGLLLTPDGHVDLENLQRENPLNEHGKTD